LVSFQRWERSRRREQNLCSALHSNSLLRDSLLLTRSSCALTEVECVEEFFVQRCLIWMTGERGRAVYDELLSLWDVIIATGRFHLIRCRQTPRAIGAHNGEITVPEATCDVVIDREELPGAMRVEDELLRRGAASASRKPMRATCIKWCDDPRILPENGPREAVANLTEDLTQVLQLHADQSRELDVLANQRRGTISLAESFDVPGPCLRTWVAHA
jgi:hypothetical protein